MSCKSIKPVSRLQWVCINGLLSLLGVMWLAAAASAAVTAGGEADPVTVIKSEADSREYRYLTLPNQLQVLLISDPQAPRAAAAMDITVGSADDPDDREGMAHFLEHMLFLGTERYPDAGEYQRFISDNGGSHNAFTADEQTNFFFEVDPAKIDEALDRFSQFFVAPLFTPEYVDRERHAVNSEYLARIKDDSRRQFDVLRQLVNSRHPLSHFSVGSLDTLADRPDHPVRDDLLNFYLTHYSAERMALVVLGRESLDQLQAMVVPRFAAVPQRPVVEPVTGQSLFSNRYLPAQIVIEPEKDLRRLTLMFPIPPADAHYRVKPLYFLADLIGHEGAGSLLSALKTEGWAQGLAAGAGGGSRNQSSFTISIDLTPAGLKMQDRVVAMVFRYIRLIKNSGLDAWRYTEQQQLSEIAFRFAEKAGGMATVSHLAGNLHEYSPEDVLRGDYLYEAFDQELIRSYLDYLSPENFLRIVMAKDQSTNRMTDRYQVPYRFESLGVERVRVSKALLDQLQLPAPNEFIPRRLDIKPPQVIAATASHIPTLIRHDAVQDVWFHQDTEFSTPRAELFLRVKSPAVGADIRGAVLTELYVEMVRDALNEFAYPAQLAGLDFSLGANSRGLDLRISGYSDKQGLLLSRLAGVLTSTQFDAERFTRIQAALLRHYANSDKQTPYHQLLEVLPATLYSPMWADREKSEVLEALTLPELRQFASGFYRNAQQQVLVYGNLYEQEALKLSALLRSRLFVADEDAPALAEARVVKLPRTASPSRVHLPIAHQDSAVALYVQGEGTGDADVARILLAQQLIASPFFNQLRTEKQLGYIVFASPMPLKEVPGMVMVVQSPTTPVAQLQISIRSFLEGLNFSDEELDQARKALIQNLETPPQNLAEQAEAFWSDILHDVGSFNRREQLIAAVKALKSADFRSFFSQNFAQTLRAEWLTAAATVGEEVDQAVDWQQLKATDSVYTFK